MPPIVTIRKKISLTEYGWPGWEIGPYGKARQFRLTSPEGDSFTPEEIQSIRGAILDNDYLRSRISCLTRVLEHPAISGRLDSTRLLAAFLSGFKAILDEPLALLGESVDVRRGSKRGRTTPGLDQPIPYEIIEQLKALGLFDVPKGSDG